MPQRRTNPPLRSTADFARYVGLARTTVSRVLNGHPGVKVKTVDRVKRALDETGFTPNAFAVHLRGKGASTVGICMENLLTPPMVSKLAALQKRLRRRGFTSLIEVLEPGEGRKVVQHFQADAVVFIGQFAPDDLAERIAELRRQGVAHLVIDQSGVADANTVTIDRAGAMRQVMRMLLDLGHRSFGVLGMSGTVQSVRDRLRGISEALAERQLDMAACTRTLDYLETRENDFSFGRTVARGFARQESRPTAYVAINDEVAIGAMLGFEAAGVRVPDDVSIVGFNNQGICLMTAPTVTSVDQQIEATIDAVVEVLTAQLADPSGPAVVRMIEPVIVPRGSTGPAPQR